ncbi:MAG: hypothetical protein ACOX3R_05935 [Desulfitobacteriia bacterium]
MNWLGRKWQDILKELTGQNIEYTYEITYPQGKAVSCGDLRIARVNKVEERIKFILLHDRFSE